VDGARISLNQFFRALRGTNPFAKNRVSDGAEGEVDVAAIHQAEFGQLIRRVEDVRRGMGGAGSIGVMVLGAAGIGKSHVLARLARWARRDGQATLVLLHNVVASPQRMARYLLRATMSTLAGSRSGGYTESELYRLLNRAIMGRLSSQGRSGVPHPDDRAIVLSRILREVDGDREVARALVGFLRAALAAAGGGDPAADDRARAAVEWLSGEVIGADAAEELGLRSGDEDGASLPDDQSIELVFCQLAHLAGTAERPLVLCIDQVDNLDDEKVTALSAFLHVLIDHSRQLLVVVSGVRQSMLRLQAQQIVAEAAWDRLVQHRIELRAVDPAQARLLVQARVEQFAGPFRELGELRAAVSADSLFPLDDAWLSGWLGDQVDVRPRDALTAARDRWEQQQDRVQTAGADAWLETWPGGGPPPLGPHRSLIETVDELIDRKLVERITERKLQPDALPPDADNLATLTLSLLHYCLGRTAYTLVSAERTARGRKVPIYDLLASERRPDGTETSTGVLFLAGDNKQKSTAGIKRMLEDPHPPEQRILVTDEERRPLGLGPRGLAHYEALRKLSRRRFLHLKMDFAAHAALDAMLGLIRSARVGDLDVEFPRGEIRPLAEVEVVESLHRLNRFADQPLLRLLLTEEPPVVVPRPRPPDVDAERVRATIAGHLSWRPGLTTVEVTEELIERAELGAFPFDDVHAEIKRIAQALHARGVVDATAQDDALLLRLPDETRLDPWTSPAPGGSHAADASAGSAPPDGLP